MTNSIISLILLLFQVAVLCVLLFLCGRMIGAYKKSLTPVFLAFSLALWLFTDLYWLIYDLIRQNARMPFGANEIGEAAVFLTLAAALSATVSHGFYEAKAQAVGAVVFAACNMALWIAWSGEWLQDTLVGASFGYLLYTIACSLKAQRALRRGEWTLLGLACALLILAQTMTFFAEAGMKKTLDAACSVLLSVGVAYWGLKLLQAREKGLRHRTLLCLAYGLTAWIIMAKYMSEGMIYLLLMFAETLSLPPLFLSAGKAVEDR